MSPTAVGKMSPLAGGNPMLGFVLHPEGCPTIANVSTLAEVQVNGGPSEGMADGLHAISAVPSGLGRTGGELPNLERLGYCRRSLRDRPFVDFQVHFQLQILLALDWQSARCLRPQVANLRYSRLPACATVSSGSRSRRIVWGLEFGILRRRSWVW